MMELLRSKLGDMRLTVPANELAASGVRLTGACFVHFEEFYLGESEKLHDGERVAARSPLQDCCAVDAFFW